MSENKYRYGSNICQQLFEKTGDPRYYVMRNDFLRFEKEHIQGSASRGNDSGSTFDENQPQM